MAVHSQIMDNTSFQHGPREVVKSLFDEAKMWWSFGLSLKLLAALIGIVFVFLKVTSSLAPGILSLMAIASELCTWRSDFIKGRAESFKRKIEYFDGFGWPLSGIDMSNQLKGFSTKRRAEIEKTTRENYFASKEFQGPRRAIENLQESSWWSKDLASCMGNICAVTMVSMLILSLATLYVSISTIRNYDVLQSVNRVVVAILSLVISLGLLRLTASYIGFSRKSEEIEKDTVVLLNNPDVSEVQAAKLLYEYQLSRSSAPFIPEWIWKMRRNTLNELWEVYRQDQKN